MISVLRGVRGLWWRTVHTDAFISDDLTAPSFRRALGLVCLLFFELDRDFEGSTVFPRIALLPRESHYAGEFWKRKENQITKLTRGRNCPPRKLLYSSNAKEVLFFSWRSRRIRWEPRNERERQTEEGLKKTNCTTEKKRKIRRHADRRIEGQQMQDGEREEFDPVRRKFDVVYFYKGKVDRRRDGETTKERSRLINNGCQRRAFFGESIRTYKRNKKKTK